MGSGETQMPSERSLSSRFVNRLALLLSVFALIAAFAIPAVFPVHFRNDDLCYLDWANKHSPLDAIDPGEAQLFGMFRPAQNLTWWCLYHAFGMNPFGYQVFCTLIYGLSLVLFFMLAARMFSGRVAVLSLATYVLVLFPLSYIIFWFSDLTFILEMFFANLSLMLLVSAIESGKWTYLWGIIAYVCAVCSKEPAAITVPAVLLTYLAVGWRDLEKSRKAAAIWVSSLLMCAGVAWVGLNPYVQTRQGIGFDVPFHQIISFISQRWTFFANALTSELGIAIWICALYLVIRQLASRWSSRFASSRLTAIAAAALISIPLMSFPSIGLAVLLVALIPCVIRRDRSAVAAVWFAVPLAGLMTISYVVRTQLVETAFGIALLMGIALDDMAHVPFERFARQKPSKRLIITTSLLLTAICLAGTVMIAPKLTNKLNALQIVSACRLNVSDTASFIATNKPVEVAIDIVVVDYSNMGLNYERDVLPMPDIQKAHLQKPMTSEALGIFLQLLDARAVTVHDLTWLGGATANTPVFLMTMNLHEEQFVEDMGLRKTLVYESERHGERARLFRLWAAGQ